MLALSTYKSPTMKTDMTCPIKKHPPVKAGAMASFIPGRHLGAGFQSSPAREGGCDVVWLTRPGRHEAFQSSPAREGGCDPIDGRTAIIKLTFQSSPAREGGCDANSHAPLFLLFVFQSSPAREGGCDTRQYARPPISSAQIGRAHV